MTSFEDTLTDSEFTSALRDSPLASLDAGEPAEPDLSVDGLGHSLVSRLLTLLLPKGPG